MQLPSRTGLPLFDLLTLEAERQDAQENPGAVSEQDEEARADVGGPTATVSLPIIETCAGCGACCEHMTAPPFRYGSETGELWNLPKYLRNDLIRFRNDCPSLDGTPCRWLDPETKVCRHYEWRPRICRDFQFGGLNCLRLRHGRRPPASWTAAERAMAKAGLFKPLSEYIADNRLYEEVHTEIDDELRERGVEFEALSYQEVEAAEIRGLSKVAKRLLIEIKGELE